MPVKCPECSNTFRSNNALCVDLNDPKKSFGCPHCGTFFLRRDNHHTKDNWKQTLFLLGIMLPVLNLMFLYYRDGGPHYVLGNGAIILLSGIAICLITELPFARPLVKSGFRLSMEAKQKPEQDAN